MAKLQDLTTDHEKLEGNMVTESRHSNTSVSQKTAFPRWNQKGREQSNIARVCTWIVDNQINISVTLLTILFLVHNLQPSSQRYTRKFFSISYYNKTTGNYALGWDDIFFVFYWIIVFTGLRCFVMSYLLMPLGEALGLKKPKAKTRFTEQAWILIYPTFSWSVGMYIMYNSDYWLDLRALWRGWPHREMDGLSKWYYLVQFAFWLQQIVVVNIEERRKDHWQMFTHHLITCALIFGSYGYHWSRVGNVVLCLMDVVDLFLPLAKILKYLKYRTACDATFGIFMVTWLFARHVFYGMVCWSAYKHSPQEIEFGCYQGSVSNLTGPTPIPNDWMHVVEPYMDPVGQICFNQNVQYTFIGLLLALQVVLLVWFVMIVRVAYKVITGQGAEDVRSDDDDSGEEEEDEEEEKEQEEKEMEHKRQYDRENAISETAVPGDTSQFLEKECLSTDQAFTTTQTTRSSTASRSPAGRSSRRKGDGHSSGVNLLAGSDRKELLGRIGCDKTADQ